MFRTQRRNLHPAEGTGGEPKAKLPAPKPPELGKKPESEPIMKTPLWPPSHFTPEILAKYYPASQPAQEERQSSSAPT